MPGHYKLYLDTFCEVYDLLSPYADGEFWDLTDYVFQPNSVYVIGRHQFHSHSKQIFNAMTHTDSRVVFSNPAEGSSTMLGQIWMMPRFNDAPGSRHENLKILAGGDMNSDFDYLMYENFLPKILDYDENIRESARINEIYEKTEKPYKFLFLNGRIRSHRKYLIDRFLVSGLINESLWTMLDSSSAGSKRLWHIHEGRDTLLDPLPHKFLDPYYEVDKYSKRPTDQTYAKYELFNEEWGEIYLKAEPYIDTYFSLVTETVFDYPYSFRTEKIWKPIVMGHPWIAVSNAGYYRDLRNLGYKTYDHLIDESFDLIHNGQSRIERIATVVEDLCKQDLSAFLREAESISKYNIERHKEHRLEVRKEFPKRFFKFIEEWYYD